MSQKQALNSLLKLKMTGKLTFLKENNVYRDLLMFLFGEGLGLSVLLSALLKNWLTAWDRMLDLIDYWSDPGGLFLCSCETDENKIK